VSLLEIAAEQLRAENDEGNRHRIYSEGEGESEKRGLEEGYGYTAMFSACTVFFRSATTDAKRPAAASR